MLQPGSAKKVTIYVNEDTQHHLSSLCDAILMFLLHKGVAGATATRAMTGFGAHRQMHTTKIEILTQHLPIRIEFVESPQKVDEILPTLCDMVTDGLIEVHDTEVVKVANKDHKAAPRVAHTELKGKARLMRIYMGESDKWQGEPLYDAVLKRLRLMDISGATVYRGILGYGAKGRTHKSKKLHMGHDCPIMVSVVDTEEKLTGVLDALEPMMRDGIIVLSDVDVIRLVHSRPAETGTDANT
jgi:PII-like signaling protein